MHVARGREARIRGRHTASGERRQVRQRPEETNMTPECVARLGGTLGSEGGKDRFAIDEFGDALDFAQANGRAFGLGRRGDDEAEQLAQRCAARLPVLRRIRRIAPDLREVSALEVVAGDEIGRRALPELPRLFVVA